MKFFFALLSTMKHTIGALSIVLVGTGCHIIVALTAVTRGLRDPVCVQSDGQTSKCNRLFLFRLQSAENHVSLVLSLFLPTE